MLDYKINKLIFDYVFNIKLLSLKTWILERRKYLIQLCSKHSSFNKVKNLLYLIQVSFKLFIINIKRNYNLLIKKIKNKIKNLFNY